MKTQLSKLMLYMFILSSLSACKEENSEQQNTHTTQTQNNNHDQHAGHTQHGSTLATIVKQVGDIQVSFDISTMSAHHKMMQDVNMPMKHDSNTSHYVMVILMDKDKNPLKDIPIKVKAVGPEGQSLGDESGLPMDVMSGNGMYHYGHGFDFEAPGKYQILVMFKQGEQVLSTGSEWEKK